MLPMRLGSYPAYIIKTHLFGEATLHKVRVRPRYLNCGSSSHRNFAT